VNAIRSWERSTVISRSPDRGTNFPGRGSLGSQQSVLHREHRLTTVHRSHTDGSGLRAQGLRLLTHQFFYLLLKPASALRVVLEHVEAGARRREQHDAARLGQRIGLRDGLLERRRLVYGYDILQRVAHQPSRFADRHYRFRAAPQRLAKASQIAAL